MISKHYKLILCIISLVAIVAGVIYVLPDMRAETLYYWYRDHMTYTTIAVLMAIESSVIPLPSEVVVPPAAYFALQLGSDLDLGMVIVVATIGAYVGAAINYGLSMLIGRPIIYGFADSRAGRMLMLSSKKLQYAEDYFRTRGAVSIFLGRLLPAVRHLISIPAGLSRMNFGTFSLFTILGAAIWNVVLAAMGYLLFLAVPSPDGLFAQLEHYNTYVKIVGYSLVALAALYIAYKIKKNRKNNP